MALPTVTVTGRANPFGSRSYGSYGIGSGLMAGLPNLSHVDFSSLVSGLQAAIDQGVVTPDWADPTVLDKPRKSEVVELRERAPTDFDMFDVLGRFSVQQRPPVFSPPVINIPKVIIPSVIAKPPVTLSLVPEC